MQRTLWNENQSLHCSHKNSRRSRNFAGVAGSADAICDLSLENFQKAMDVNSTGVFLSTKYELIQMMRQDSIQVEEGRFPQRGSIVNCASVNSQMSMAGTVAYTASKHSVSGITKAVGGPILFRIAWSCRFLHDTDNESDIDRPHLKQESTGLGSMQYLQDFC